MSLVQLWTMSITILSLVVIFSAQMPTVVNGKSSNCKTLQLFPFVFLVYGGVVCLVDTKCFFKRVFRS